MPVRNKEYQLNNKTTFIPAPRIYSYVRFSTVEQAKGKSLERQMTLARQVARERGLQLDESLTMKDLGKSGYHQDNIKKGAFGVFLDLINAGLVPNGSILVIESLDRISRDKPLKAQAIIHNIIESGITVITAIDKKEYSQQSLENNSIDLILILLVFIRAHEESEAKSARAIGTIIAKCLDWIAGKRGFKIDCGRQPKWLKWCKQSKAYIFVEREKQIILRKIELFKTGYGGLKIAKMLNEEFGNGTVHHTGANIYKEVRRRNLIGENQISVGGETYVLDGYFPPILTRAEYNDLHNCTDVRGAAKHSQKFIGILSGSQTFRCEQCGGTMKAHVIYRNKDVKNVNDSHKTYRCLEASRSQNCINKEFVYIGAAERAIVNYCKDAVNLERIMLTNNSKHSVEEKIAELTHQNEELQIKVDRLVDVLEVDGEIAPILKRMKNQNAKIDENNAKIAKYKAKINKISSASTAQIIEKWNEITKNLDELGNDERLDVRLLVKDTFKAIIFHPTTNAQKTGIADEVFRKRNELLSTDIGNTEYADLTLHFHNDLVRIMRINKKTGELIKGFDLTDIRN